jgi:hypothetical protein
VQREPPHLPVVVEVHQHRKTQASEDYERNERQVDGRVASIRGEIRTWQSDEPRVAKCGNGMKDRLKQAFAIT